MQQRKRRLDSAVRPHPGTTSQVPDWAGLHPLTIVSLGVPTQPIERLIGLQSGVYRLIFFLDNVPSLFSAWRLFRLSAMISQVLGERLGPNHRDPKIGVAPYR